MLIYLKKLEGALLKKNKYEQWHMYRHTTVVNTII